MKRKALPLLLVVLSLDALGWGLFETEPNDARATANGPIFKGDQVNGTVSSSDPQDYFSFNAAAGEGWAFSGTGGVIAPSAISLAIEDASGTILGSGGPGTPVNLSFHAPSAGAYYLRVSPPSNTAYIVTVSGISGVTDWSLY